MYLTVLLQLCFEQGPSTSDSSKRKIQVQSRTTPTWPVAIKPLGNCQERAVCLQRQALLVKSSNNYFCLVKSLFEYHHWFSITTSQISPHNSCYWQQNYSVYQPHSSHYFVSCKSSINSHINFFFFLMWCAHVNLIALYKSDNILLRMKNNAGLFPTFTHNMKLREKKTGNTTEKISKLLMLRAVSVFHISSQHKALISASW